MNAWNPRASEVFLKAIAVDDPTERQRLIAAECGGDAELLGAVETLLHAHEQAEGFLAGRAPGATDAVAVTGTIDLPGREETVGSVVAGRYKLKEPIGEGGMGSVFLAQQTEPVRRAVAVKVIKAGMDSKVVLARFEKERQALAMMDHPNIARVLDAGTADSGRPFFVMELVKGQPITKFCDERKLTLRQRLELFVPVCQAIQHAHQKGVIHRDIKPSNVLVAMYDDRPVPKVIDFGIAKATGLQLGAESLMTNLGAVVGTPEYMSPEQAKLNNIDVDTRSDVYSLGVLLYELLTGSTPVDRKSLGRAALFEILRIVREVEAPPPSAKLSTLDTLPNVAAARGTEPARLSMLLRGDLDWIVLKALEKDRARRYETANNLAADVLRHLADEPVLASPPGRGYRLRKFVLRNRTPVFAGMLVALSLVVGTVGTIWALRQAVAARQVADEKADLARQKQGEAAIAAAEARKSLADMTAAKNELEKSVGSLSIATQFAADAAFAENRVLRAHQLLSEVPVGLRGWEWYWRKRLFTGGNYTLFGHTKAVTSVAFSADGTLLVSGSDDGTVRVWDSSSGAERASMKKHTKAVKGLALSPDNSLIVSGSDDASLKMWDAATGTERAVFPGHKDKITCVAFSPDGTRIVSGCFDGVAKVWDAASGAEHATLKGHRGFVCCAAFSPDGKRIAVGAGDGTVKIWDASDGTERATIAVHTLPVSGLAFSPDGLRIASSSWDRTVKLWDAASGAVLFNVKGHMSLVHGVAFSPDGTRISSGASNGTVKILDAASGAELATLAGHTDRVSCVAFNPDGTRIASGSGDMTVKVWDAAVGDGSNTFKGHTGSVNSVAFSPDGLRIATGSWDRTVKVWDAAKGVELATLKGHLDRVNSVAFSPDGLRIASSSVDRTVKVWDAAKGVELAALKGHLDRVNSVAFSPDGLRIATGSWDRTVKVWDAAKGVELATLKGHAGWVSCVAFSPNGTRVASGSWDRTVKVWDVAGGTVCTTLKGHADFVHTVAFSPDGMRIASGSLDKTVKLWDVGSGANVGTLTGHKEAVRSVAFSPDGTRIVSGSFDKSLKVWDAASGAERASLRGHTDYVTSTTFSPDGMRIVSGSNDNSLKVWDAASSSEVATLKGQPNAIANVAFSSDGTRILADSGEGAIRVWDAATGTELMESGDAGELVGLQRKHPAKNWWLHPAGHQVVVIDLTITERENSFRMAKAMFKPLEVDQLYEAASTTYAKAFWKSRLALHKPLDIRCWDAFRRECQDAATWRLMKRTCDLVLQKGPNSHAVAARAWAIQQLSVDK